MAEKKEEKCPDCKGEKQVTGYYTVGPIDCPTCGGTGLAAKAKDAETE